MNIKNVTFSNTAREDILKGINILSDAVSSTLGAEGRTVIIEDVSGYPQITKDGVTVAKSIVLEDPIENIGATLIKQAASKTVDSVGDGCQPLYSKILTPNGWINMGDIKQGMEICGTNGSFQTVLGVYPKEEREIFRVTLSDGRSTECSGDHMWTVITSYGAVKNMTTLELINSGKVNSTSANGEIRHGFYLPRSKSQFNDKRNILSPYLVGVLLGDGSLSGTGSVEISLGENKRHILGKIILPEGIVIKDKYVDNKNYIRAKISGCDLKGKYIKDYLSEIGLYEIKSDDKFIPKSFLYDSIDNREQLLQGLLDTDGYINKRGLFEFSTVSKQLFLDFLELCNSLDIPVYSRLHNRKNDKWSYSDKPIYRVSELKGYKNGSKISSIVSTDKYLPVQCIKVSNEDSLYITDNYIVTHNTTTATVLAAGIINRAMKEIDNGASPIWIKRDIEHCANFVFNELKNMAIPITKDKLFNVATISANNDVALGEVISEAFEKTGDNGMVVIESSENEKTYIEYVEGMSLKRGYESHYFITDEGKQRAILEKPLILILDSKVDRIDDLIRFIEMASKSKRSLLILGELDEKIISVLAMNKIQNGLKVCVVKPAMFGDRKRQMLQDLAIATGAIVLSDETGDNIDVVGFDALGEAVKVIVSIDDTIVMLNDNFKVEIDDRVDGLKKRFDDSDNFIEKGYLKERISNLSGGVAIINVGAASEVELKEKKDRVDDAVNAVKASMLEGIVAGGGVALLNISDKIETTTIGGEILKESIKDPFKKILSNAGEDYLKYTLEEGEGVNVKTMQVVDMIKEGIIDPVKVTRKALENAISVAGTILLTDTVVSIARAK